MEEQEMSLLDYYRTQKLNDIVVDALERNVISQVEVPDKTAYDAVRRAVLNNVYITDKNSIDSIEELASRVNHNYAKIYAPYFGVVSEDPVMTASALDEMVRTVLTMTALVWCAANNRLGDLDLFIGRDDAKDGIEFITNSKCEYLGCILYTINGVIYNTRTGVMKAGRTVAGLPMDVLEIINNGIGIELYNRNGLLEARNNMVRQEHFASRDNIQYAYEEEMK